MAKSILKTKEIIIIGGTVEQENRTLDKTLRSSKIYSCTNGNIIYEIMPPETSEKTVDF